MRCRSKRRRKHAIATPNLVPNLTAFLPDASEQAKRQCVIHEIEMAMAAAIPYRVDVNLHLVGSAANSKPHCYYCYYCYLDGFDTVADTLAHRLLLALEVRIRQAHAFGKAQER